MSNNDHHDFPDLSLTPGQERTYERLREDHPNAMIDWPGTTTIRARVGGGSTFIAVIAATGEEIFMWILDARGDVIEEGGAKRRRE